MTFGKKNQLYANIGEKNVNFCWLSFLFNLEDRLKWKRD